MTFNTTAIESRDVRIHIAICLVIIDCITVAVAFIVGIHIIFCCLDDTSVSPFIMHTVWR